MPKYGHSLVEVLFSPVLIFFAFLGNICLVGSMYFFYIHEKGVNESVENWLDVLWWAVVTVTTVGYGDVVPVTAEGKVAGIFLMLTGIVFFVSFSTALVSLFFVKVELDLEKTHRLTYKEFEIIMKEIKTLREEVKHLRRK